MRFLEGNQSQCWNLSLTRMPKCQLSQQCRQKTSTSSSPARPPPHPRRIPPDPRRAPASPGEPRRGALGPRARWSGGPGGQGGAWGPRKHGIWGFTCHFTCIQRKNAENAESPPKMPKCRLLSSKCRKCRICRPPLMRVRSTPPPYTPLHHPTLNYTTLQLTPQPYTPALPTWRLSWSWSCSG